MSKQTLHEVRELSRNLGRLPIPGSSHFKSLEVNQEPRTTLFSPKKLRELSEAYIRNVHVLHPMFDAPRNMCDAFIKEYSDTAVVGRDFITPCLGNANVLLFLALGSCGSIRDRSGQSSIPPGMAYYSYAQGILEREAYSVALAQTMTLAALYTNQFGMFRESWKSISCAYGIHMVLGH
jgi:hypothetical protein